MKTSKDALCKIDNAVMKLGYIPIYIGTVSLFVIMLICFVDMLTSKFLLWSIPHGMEMVKYLNIVAAFSGLAYLELLDRNVTIGLVHEKLPKPVQKACIALAYVCGLTITVLLTWRGGVKFLTEYSNGTLSGTTIGFVVWPFALYMFLMFAMAAFAYIWSLFRLFAHLPVACSEEMNVRKRTWGSRSPFLCLKEENCRENPADSSASENEQRRDGDHS